MVEQSVLIKNKTGLHARPASLFVQAANRFKSRITVRKGDAEIDAKSMLSVLSLGAAKGVEITLVADGEDEREALAHLTSLLETLEE